ncbi:uncharacterized protein EV420DRAFT_1487057 [Desarmillaria tabescens]|uniref:Uncharacterized protein n=1 Tax=Armillaria tabescens TaxID=1929756 RepID=A0AA39J7Q3_ARMTA|nr:uncharacterized protein EV420DRAFT_1487057 [Desarmillaria tabescens]KAK0437588.1 hypothetical protein EV420DRAFT_1487057 [Desarmillaria tabescens]
MDTQAIENLSQLFGNMSVQDLWTALKNAQVQNQTLQNKIRALQMAPAPIDSSSGPTSQSSQISAGNMNSVLNNASGQASILKTKESKEIFQMAGRRLVIFGHTWWEKKDVFGIGQSLA